MQLTCSAITLRLVRIALGPRLGAARVEQLEGVVLVDVRGGRLGVRVLHPIEKRLPAGGRRRGLEGMTARTGISSSRSDCRMPLRHSQQRLLHDERARPGMGEDVPDLGAAEHVVDRHAD